MKHLTLAVIGVSVLAVAILGASRVAAAALPGGPRSHLNSIQIMGIHVNLRSASAGRISENDSYQTADTMASVLARYSEGYHPAPGQPKPGQCVMLQQASGNFVFRQSVLLTLCPAGAGTQVDVSRDLFVGP